MVARRRQRAGSVPLRRALALASWAGAVLAAVAACQVVVPLEGFRVAAIASVDAGAPRPVSQACSAEMPPPLTTVLPGGGDISVDLVFGSLVADARTDAGATTCPVPGFNLDKRTTCIDSQGQQIAISACPAGEGCVFGPSCSNKMRRHNPCDFPGGVDNALGRALGPEFLGSIPGVDRRQIEPNSVLKNGVGNVILRVAGYNGREDDDDVSVSFFVASGIAGTTAPVEPLRSDGGFIPSNLREYWDGKSLRTWYVDPNSVESATFMVPKYSVDGYVRGGLLIVAAAPREAGAPSTVLVPLLAPIAVEHVQLTGELRLIGDEWHIQRGNLAGRVLVSNLVEQLSKQSIMIDGTFEPLCKNEAIQALVRNTACELADLADTPGGDCTHLSVGMTFTAVPATVGPVRPGLQAGDMNPCPNLEYACLGVR